VDPKDEEGYNDMEGKNLVNLREGGPKTKSDPHGKTERGRKRVERDLDLDAKTTRIHNVIAPRGSTPGAKGQATEGWEKREKSHPLEKKENKKKTKSTQATVAY